MNYKKKYDEALERARKLNENPQSVFNEYSPKEGDTICDYIFPELRESENEKIRKELITHCRNTRCVTEEGAKRIAKWIAWLEKQDSNVDNANKEYWRGYREGKQEILDKYAELEKQGEKKYAWGEEDEKIRKRIILCLEECVHNDIIHDYEKEKCLAWLKRQVTPQMVEDAFLKGCNDTKKCLLKRQSEQKPAWSEEDEKEYKYVLKFVDNILNNCGNKKDYDHCKRCYDWLKSIKQKIGG